MINMDDSKHKDKKIYIKLTKENIFYRIAFVF